MTNPVAELRRQIEIASARTDLAPVERMVLLRSLRESLVTALGDVDRYMGDLNLEREAEAADQQDEALEARWNADVREQMIERGLATPEQMDEIGYYSHDRLDEMAEEHGTLTEALSLRSFAQGVLTGEALRRFNEMHARGRGGRWVKMFGKVSSMNDGDRVHVGQGVTVSKRGGEFHVKTAGGTVVHRGPNPEAATHAADAQFVKQQVTGTTPPTQVKYESAVDHVRRILPKLPNDRDEAAAQIRVAIREREREGASEKERGEAASLRTHLSTIRAYQPESDLPPEEQKKLWKERRAEMEKRVKSTVAKRMPEAEAKLASGKATGTTGIRASHELGDAEVHFNAAGKVSQHTLGRYAREASSQPTTLERHSHIDPETGRRVWNRSRQQLHEAIVDTLLRQQVEGKDPDTGDTYWRPARPDEDVPYLPQSSAPSVLFMGGGYSAGKSSVREMFESQGEAPDSGYDGPVLTIDPDQIKAMLPEFQARIGSDPEANCIVYEEAWEIAQELQRRAIEHRISVVVDGISNTSPLEMVARARAFTDAGYEARAVYVDIPTDEALRRAALRAQKAKKLSDRRHIPEVVMRAVHRDVAATVPALIDRVQRGDVPLAVELWDNDQGLAGYNADGSPNFNPPRRFASFDPTGGEPGAEGEHGVNIEDEALWRRFQSKAFEEIPEVDQPPGTATVGITPYKEGETVPEVEGDFYHSTRFRDFETDLIREAEAAGVTISFRDRTEGLWEGESEPSYSIQMHDGEKIGPLVEKLGAKYGQDGVVTFTPGDGPDVQVTISGVDPKAVQDALRSAGIPGATIRGDQVEIMGTQEDLSLDKLSAIREALGLDAGALAIRTGTFEFHDTSGGAESARERVTGEESKLQP